NGNYVVHSMTWNGGRGALTWGSGTQGVTGVVSDVNSLVGSSPPDKEGYFDVPPLSNGNHVALNPFWNGGRHRRHRPGSRGEGGHWDGNRGAVAWGSATAGVQGTIYEADRLVGANPYDEVGDCEVIALSNGNYVVRSPRWNGGRGAATWGDGNPGVRGVVSD